MKKNSDSYQRTLEAAEAAINGQFEYRARLDPKVAALGKVLFKGTSSSTPSSTPQTASKPSANSASPTKAPQK